jgi:hypothetical protein
MSVQEYADTAPEVEASSPDADAGHAVGDILASTTTVVATYAFVR